MGSCVDAQLWKACAGGMVKVPLVNSNVTYFPQGHAEHAKGVVNFEKYQEIPDLVQCRVVSVKYMASVETDDVYLRMSLVPVSSKEDDFMEIEGDDLVGCLIEDGAEKCSSFTKILTQSDANNGGGFSVPRHCAESLFPKLDYLADPPVQNLYIKDVHGVVWKFRHIYRGTPRRHLLTTGWSNFVNDKKLVAGDSVIFLKAGNGELCIGIRRANRGISRVRGEFEYRGGLWESGRFTSVFENGSKGGQMSSVCSPNKYGKVSAETVLETARRAAAGRKFEVDYYPQAGFPEFCVKSSVVSAALRIKWCVGMELKMSLESEDAPKDKWLVGMIQAVQAADPVRWPKSPWRMLQVIWDEPTLTNNVERVSPWSVDIAMGGMLNMMHPLSLSNPMKRLRLTQPPELPLHGLHLTTFPDPFIHNLSYHPVADRGIQGARHVQFGQYPLNPHLNIPSNPHYFPHVKKPLTAPPPSPVGANFRAYQRNKDDTLRLCASGMSPLTPEKNEETEPKGFVLFGQRIVLEVKKSQSSCAAKAVSSSISKSVGNMYKVKSGTGSSESGSVQNLKECYSDGRSSAEMEMHTLSSGA